MIYRDRLSSLNKFVMVKFEQDKMIVPKDTAWFGYLNEKGKVVDLRNQTIYTDDFIGLKRLDEQKRLFFETLPGEHVKLN